METYRSYFIDVCFRIKDLMSLYRKRFVPMAAARLVPTFSVDLIRLRRSDTRPANCVVSDSRFNYGNRVEICIRYWPMKR